MPFVIAGGGEDGPKSLLELWLAYCAKRGLTPEILAPMGGALLDLDTASKPEFLGKGILAFRKYGAVGAFVYNVGTSKEGRIMYQPGVSAVGEAVAKQHGAKYYRPPGSTNHAYLYPGFDWKNHKGDLVIVEGVLNAVRLAAEGIPAISIPGVYNWRVGKKGTPMIPALEELLKSADIVRVIAGPDSDTDDMAANPQLWNAIHDLMSAVMRLRPARRNTIFTWRPPALANGDKQGPDDFLQAVGREAFLDHMGSHLALYADDPFLQAEGKACARFIFEEDTGRLFDCEQRKLVEVQHANLLLAGFGRVYDITSPKPKARNYTVSDLLNAPTVRHARGVRFNPATPEIWFPDDDAICRINSVQPEDYPVPVPSDVSPFYDLLKHLCPSSPSAVAKIALIAAWHAQYPAGTPLYGILLPGEQGSGKSLMARLIGTALSRRFHCGRVETFDGFNSTWRGYACKEWAEYNHNMDAEWLKDLITAEEYEVRVKYGGEYPEKNHTLNIFTSNELRAHLQAGDRRFVIGGYAQKLDGRIGKYFYEWIKGVGPAILRHHLLNEVDTSTYENMGVETEYRSTVIEASRTRGDDLREVVEDAVEDAGLECAPVFFISTILKPYNTTAQAFFKMNASHYPKPFRDDKVKINGGIYRFRIFANLPRWAKEDNQDAYAEQLKKAEDRLMTLGLGLNSGKY